MKDRFDRTIHYMRISVTDRCNLRCRYCMPAEGVTLFPSSDILSFEEIVSVCRAAVSLGITDFRLTGGEPLVRRDLPKLVSMIAKIPGISSLGMTTNGILLAGLARELAQAGLTSVNISLDTFVPEDFRFITRCDQLDAVLAGIDAAQEAGLKVKINTVLLAGEFFPSGEEGWRSVLPLAKDRPIPVRFIELMPIGEGARFPAVPADDVLRELTALFAGIRPDNTVYGNGPAEYYRIPGFAGSIGLIRAVHGHFCGDCSRIRLSADGHIRPCLCREESFDVRGVLRGEKTQTMRKNSAGIAKPAGGTAAQEPLCMQREEAVREVLCRAILAKPAAHDLEQRLAAGEGSLAGRSGEAAAGQKMVSIGG